MSRNIPVASLGSERRSQCGYIARETMHGPSGLLPQSGESGPLLPPSCHACLCCADKDTPLTYLVPYEHNHHVGTQMTGSKTSLNLLNLFLFHKYLFASQLHLLVHSPRRLKWLGQGQAEAMIQELHVGLPPGWQDPMHLDHLLLLSQAINRDLAL